MAFFDRMKHSIYIFLLSIFLFSCHSGTRKTESVTEHVLTVTVEPQRFFLEQLVGDAYTVQTLLPPGATPETYEPPPSVMIAMGKSLLYFKVGALGFENAWSQRLAANYPDIRIVDCSKGVELMREAGHHHPTEAAHPDNAAGAEAGVSGLPKVLPFDVRHEAPDPHIWSSPRTAKIMVENMYEALAESDPDNRERFRTGYEGLLEMLQRTDSLIRLRLASAPSHAFMIYHPALGYFARDYGLLQYSIEFEGKKPSPAQIRRSVDLARREKIHTVFIQRGFDMKNAEVIAEEIGAELFEINPLGYEWEEELLRIADILSRHDVNHPEKGEREGKR